MRVTKKQDVVEAWKIRPCVVRLRNIDPNKYNIKGRTSNVFQKSLKTPFRPFAVPKKLSPSLIAQQLAQSDEDEAGGKLTERMYKGPLKKRPLNESGGGGGIGSGRSTPIQKGKMIKTLKTQVVETPPPTIASSRSRRSIKPNPKYASEDMVTPKMMKSSGSTASALRHQHQQQNESVKKARHAVPQSESSDDFFEKDTDDDEEPSVKKKNDDQPYVIDDSETSDIEMVPPESSSTKKTGRPKKINLSRADSPAVASIQKPVMNNVVKTNTQLQQLQKVLSNRMTSAANNISSPLPLKRKIEINSESPEQIARKKLLLTPNLSMFKSDKSSSESPLRSVITTPLPVSLKPSINIQQRINQSSEPVPSFSNSNSPFISAAEKRRALLERSLPKGITIRATASPISRPSVTPQISQRTIITPTSVTSKAGTFQIKTGTPPQMRAATPQTKSATPQMRAATPQIKTTPPQIKIGLPPSKAAPALPLKGAAQPLKGVAQQPLKGAAQQLLKGASHQSLKGVAQPLKGASQPSVKTSPAATPPSLSPEKPRELQKSVVKRAIPPVKSRSASPALPKEPETPETPETPDTPDTAEADSRASPAASDASDDSADPFAAGSTDVSPEESEQLPTFTIVNIHDIINKKGDALIPRSSPPPRDDSPPPPSPKQINNNNNEPEDIPEEKAPSPPPTPAASKRERKVPTPVERTKKSTRKITPSAKVLSIRKEDSPPPPPLPVRNPPPVRNGKVGRPKKSEQPAKKTGGRPPTILNHTLNNKLNKGRLPTRSPTIITKVSPDKPAPRILNSMVAKKTEPVKPVIANFEDSADEGYQLSLDGHDETEGENSDFEKTLDSPSGSKDETTPKAKENSSAITNCQTTPEKKRLPTVKSPTEKTVIQRQGDRIIKKVTCFETWFVLNIEEEKPGEYHKNQLEMPLIELANGVNNLPLPGANWTSKVSLYELAPSADTSNLVQYNGDLSEHNIDEENRDRYQPSCVMFRRAVLDNSKRLPYDRALIFKNKTFFTNIDGKNVRLIGAPYTISAFEEIEILLELLEGLSLESPFVEPISTTQ